jgi:hypothetical protein
VKLAAANFGALWMNQPDESSKVNRVNKRVTACWQRVTGACPVCCLFFNTFFPRKSCRLCDNVKKYGTARQATDDNNTAHAFYMLDN